MGELKMHHIELLVQSRRACLVAPAGCGKTEVIARAVALSDNEERRQLILTHTHAGVDALRRRLKELQVPTKKYQVDTIAGWALRYASAFPTFSGIDDSQPLGKQWECVYESTASLLEKTVIRRVVASSYCGVYVDEYQDCTKTMHGLISSLSDIIPCRILGDPLQGIFGFGNETLVDWDEDIVTSYWMLPELNYGWRWDSVNPSLGEWLLRVRTCLQEGCPVDLRKAPSGVRWKRLPDKKFQFTKRLEVCREFYDVEDNVVAIFQWPHQCHSIAARLNGLFQSVEPMESEDLFDAADRMFSKSGADRALEIVLFCSKCLTKIKSELKFVCNAVASGRVQNRKYKYQEQLDALLEVSRDKSNSLHSTLDALLTIRRMPGAVLYRKDLFTAMCQSIREFESGEFGSLRDAAVSLRNMVRRAGRIPFRRVVTRTLLVKGLEYDHAVILDADSMDVKNLYVAMTRGRKSLTVLSRRPIIHPQLSIAKNSE